MEDGDLKLLVVSILATVAFSAAYVYVFSVKVLSIKKVFSRYKRRLFFYYSYQILARSLLTKIVLTDNFQTAITLYFVVTIVQMALDVIVEGTNKLLYEYRVSRAEITIHSRLQRIRKWDGTHILITLLCFSYVRMIFDRITDRYLIYEDLVLLLFRIIKNEINVSWYLNLVENPENYDWDTINSFTIKYEIINEVVVLLVVAFYSLITITTFHIQLKHRLYHNIRFKYVVIHQIVKFLGRLFGISNKNEKYKEIRKSFQYLVSIYSPVTKKEWVTKGIKGSKCVICQEPIKKKKGIVKLNCGHIYHKKCIREWVRIKKFCPICKADLVPESGLRNQTPLNFLYKTKAYINVFNMIYDLWLNDDDDNT